MLKPITSSAPVQGAVAAVNPGTAGGIPPQHQVRKPGVTEPMRPQPYDKMEGYVGSGKLSKQVACITGGDSGIGRAIAIAFAKEGADVAICYLNEEQDARDTAACVEEQGQKALLLSGDVGEPSVCDEHLVKILGAFGALHIVVNNAAEQHPQEQLTDISPEQLERTFRTNIFSYFYLTSAALPHLAEGASIINTTSVTAYRGSAHLIDYSATKGAIVSFTRSLALSLADRKIRVNGVAPGPIWTPLIPSTFDPEHVGSFGQQEPLGRAGEPDEVAPSFVFLASRDASYMTGQVLHPNGGAIING